MLVITSVTRVLCVNITACYLQWKRLFLIKYNLLNFINVFQSNFGILTAIMEKMIKQNSFKHEEQVMAAKITVLCFSYLLVTSI